MERKVLVYGDEIDFDEFKTGGVQLLELFLNSPGQWFSRNRIAELIGSDGNMIQYISRLRTTLRVPLTSRAAKLDRDLTAGEEDCFIGRDRKQYRQADSQTRYRLALEPEQVQIRNR